MTSFRSSLEDLMGIASKALVLLERDSTVLDMLQRPDTYSFLERKAELENKVLSISHSFLLSSPPVYFTLMDMRQNVYATFIPRERFNHAALLAEPWSIRLQQQEPSGFWEADTVNYLSKETSRSPILTTLYGSIRDHQLNVAGLYRASIDMQAWFHTLTASKGLPRTSYMLLDREGRVLLASNELRETDSQITTRIVESGLERESFTDNKGSNLLHYTVVPSLGIYIVKSVPNEVLFAELNELQQSSIITFLLLTLSFVLITFFLSSTMTKPLQLLERKMSQAGNNNLLVSLNEEVFRGELRSLARSFNGMIQDIQHLLQRLKREAKEREAVRFQVLLAQMNPHFLLNTLNTIKSISVRRSAPEIHDICLSLGRVLEVSLNTEKDMIHLRKEIEVVKAYLNIQAFRFEHDIGVFYDYDEELAYALVPKFSLQPLIENALVHGFKQMTSSGIIHVRAYQEEQMLVLEVADNGVGWEAAHSNRMRRSRAGISHQNIQERLKLIFKEDGIMSIHHLEQGLAVRLKFPLLLSAPH